MRPHNLASESQNSGPEETFLHRPIQGALPLQPNATAIVALATSECRLKDRFHLPTELLGTWQLR